MRGDEQAADRAEPTGPPDPGPATAEPQTGAGGRRRGLSAAERARLDRIFGDVLHETAGDEPVPGGSRESDSDAFLRANVPPHHG